MRFGGMAVIVTPDLPKMKLAPGDYITPEYRAEVNAWLLAFFGTVNIIPDGESRISELLGQVWMNPRTYRELCRQCEQVYSAQWLGEYPRTAPPHATERKT